jgi:hypothetical protein
MATAEKPVTNPQEDLGALQEAIDRAVNGIRRPAVEVRGGVDVVGQPRILG